MSVLGAPDFSSATPPPGAAGQALLDEGGRQQQAQEIRTTQGVNNGYMNDVFAQRTLPQLQSSIGANGQYYSGARKNAEGFATEDFMKQGYDLNSAVGRQLNDLTRQRMFQATGLIV